jgi:hypothetical protein
MSKIVVVDEYQLPRIDGNRFENDLSIAKKKRSKMAVSLDYVEDINSCSDTCGKRFVIDEEATEALRIHNENKRNKKAADDELNRLSDNVNLKNLLSLVQQPEEKPKRAKKKVESSKPTLDNSVEEIKEYMDNNNIDYHHALKDKERLLEIIG